MNKPIKVAGKKIISMFPKIISKRLLADETAITDRDILIQQQSERIGKLEERNDEWAREVRELRSENATMYIILPVLKSDLKKAIIRKNKKSSSGVLKRDALATPIISWVIPPMGPVSGGHTTIFRTIQGLEKHGFKCKIYIYDPLKTSSLKDILATISTYPKIDAEILYNQRLIDPCDALFATNWYTAYPVYNSNATYNKFYFVQDFEPFFDAVGSYSTLADNTYKFGFHGITLGSWMKKKLEGKYNMLCDNFDLRVNKQEYNLTNDTSIRKKVVFYARPVTPRRGFELGILALEIFHKDHPDIEIHMVGWDISRYDISFHYINHGIINTHELNELYNQCSAGLVLSFTNMSLLPLEMMAAGCIPVVNDDEHTRDVGYAEYIQYAISTPSQIASALYEATERSHDKDYIVSMSNFTTKFSWGDFDDHLAEVINKQINI